MESFDATPVSGLKGRVTVITGAGQGLGRAFAHAFAAPGAIPSRRSLSAQLASLGDLIIIAAFQFAAGPSDATSPVVVHVDGRNRIIAKRLEKPGPAEVAREASDSGGTCQVP